MSWQLFSNLLSLNCRNRATTFTRHRNYILCLFLVDFKLLHPKDTNCVVVWVRFKFSRILFGWRVDFWKNLHLFQRIKVFFEMSWCYSWRKNITKFHHHLIWYCCVVRRTGIFQSLTKDTHILLITSCLLMHQVKNDTFH